MDATVLPCQDSLLQPSRERAVTVGKKKQVNIPEISKIIHQKQYHIPEGKAEIGTTLRDLEGE